MSSFTPATGCPSPRWTRWPAGRAGCWPARADLVVFGHSHIPWDSTAANGLRLLNPGSPTDRRRQPACTYMTARLRAGTVTDVLLHTLGGPVPAVLTRP